MGPIPASFSFFVSLWIHNWQLNTFEISYWRRWDLNHGLLVSEVTALLTAPQPMSRILILELISPGSRFRRNKTMRSRKNSLSVFSSWQPKKSHKVVLKRRHSWALSVRPVSRNSFDCEALQFCWPPIGKCNKSRNGPEVSEGVLHSRRTPNWV